MVCGTRCVLPTLGSRDTAVPTVIKMCQGEGGRVQRFDLKPTEHLRCRGLHRIRIICHLQYITLLKDLSIYVHTQHCIKKLYTLINSKIRKKYVYTQFYLKINKNKKNANKSIFELDTNIFTFSFYYTVKHYHDHRDGSLTLSSQSWV